MTLYISDIEVLKKARIAYIIISAVVLACDIVSEFYSHGIYSFFSRAAFLLPLIGGAAVYTIIIKFLFKRIRLGIWSYRFYNTGIACLTVGASVKGALDVYGTSNSLVSVFLYVGLALMLLSAILCLRSSGKHA